MNNINQVEEPENIKDKLEDFCENHLWVALIIGSFIFILVIILGIWGAINFFISLINMIFGEVTLGRILTFLISLIILSVIIGTFAFLTYDKY